MTELDLAKARAEMRMALFDALPREVRDLINENNATDLQMAMLLQKLRLERFGKPPAEGRLYRNRR